MNSTAVLDVNGVKAAQHDGGYSVWRVNLTGYVDKKKEELWQEHIMKKTWN